jgi:hypothetical protein
MNPSSISYYLHIWSAPRQVIIGSLALPADLQRAFVLGAGVALSRPVITFGMLAAHEVVIVISEYAELSRRLPLNQHMPETETGRAYYSGFYYLGFIHTASGSPTPCPENNFRLVWITISWLFPHDSG